MTVLDRDTEIHHYHNTTDGFLVKEPIVGFVWGIDAGVIIKYPVKCEICMALHVTDWPVSHTQCIYFIGSVLQYAMQS